MVEIQVYKDGMLRVSKHCLFSVARKFVVLKYTILQGEFPMWFESIVWVLKFTESSTAKINLCSFFSTALSSSPCNPLICNEIKLKDTVTIVKGLFEVIGLWRRL